MLFVLLLNTIATKIVCGIGVTRRKTGERFLSDSARRLVNMRLKRCRRAQLPVELHRMFYNKMHSGIRCQKVRSMERKARARWFYKELDSHELKLEYIYSKLITHDQLLPAVA